jgi:hypothetical protein
MSSATICPVAETGALIYAPMVNGLAVGSKSQFPNGVGNFNQVKSEVNLSGTGISR